MQYRNPTCCFASGARFDDRVTGKLDEFAPEASVIHIDIDPAEISKLRTADLSLPGEIRPVLEALTALPPPGYWGIWAAQCHKHKVENPARYDYPGEDIYAPALLRSLSENFDPDPYITWRCWPAPDVGGAALPFFQP